MKSSDIFIGIVISCAFIAVVFVFLQLVNEKENFTVEIKSNDGIAEAALLTLFWIEKFNNN